MAKKWKYAILAVVFAGLVGLIVWAFPYNPAPLGPLVIKDRVDRINEAVAITVPHFELDDGKTRENLIEVFLKVENGEELTEEDNIEYRLMFQKILKDNQEKLNYFDKNLTVIADLDMKKNNNVKGLGVDGSHDHHDASARSNFADLWASLKLLQRKDEGMMTRISNAITAYKDTTDILLHLATVPHTKSTRYDKPKDLLERTNLEQDAEEVIRLFKKAQFSPVNSKEYRKSIHGALDKYDQIILQVQEIIHGELRPLERTLVGTWGAWQSFGPSLEERHADRMPRTKKTETESDQVNPSAK